MLGVLAASALALALAPLLMPPSYSVVAHTTSESAAQGIEGAWLARVGFALFGLAVVALATWVRPGWPPLATAMHGAFGVLMLAAAAFSARPWQDAAAFDETEDALHSIAASSMGVAFAIGVVATLTRRRGTGVGVLGLLAVAASVAIPTAMTVWDGGAGALQRTMFAIAYAWYGREALRVRRPAAERTMAPTAPQM